MENAEKKSGNTGEKGRIGRYSERFREFITSGKRVKLIVALGVIGIALILLSDILPEGKKSGEPVQAEQTDFYAVADALEERLTGIISGIEGVGKAKVLVTLESGVRYVYAQETKTSSDCSSDGGAGQEQKTRSSGSAEEKYIFVEDENGRRRALLITTVEPVVKGVVIICEGADNAKVKLRVMNAVTVVLGISSARVSIEKME